MKRILALVALSALVFAGCSRSTTVLPDNPVYPPVTNACRLIERLENPSGSTNGVFVKQLDVRGMDAVTFRQELSAFPGREVHLWMPGHDRWLLVGHAETNCVSLAAAMDALALDASCVALPDLFANYVGRREDVMPAFEAALVGNVCPQWFMTREIPEIDWLDVSEVDPEILGGTKERIRTAQVIRRLVVEGDIASDAAKDKKGESTATEKWARARQRCPQDLFLCERLDRLSRNARGFLEVGKLLQAMKCYETMIIIDPKDAVAVNNFGVCLKKLGKKDVAEKVLERARSLQRRFAEEFTFASWNIGHFSLGKSSQSSLTETNATAMAKSYRAFLNEVGADVIGLAEYSADFTRSGSVKAESAVFSRYSDRLIGPQHHYQWNAQFWNGGPCISTKTVEYPKHDQGVYYIATRLKIAGEEILFVSTHLDWSTYMPGHEDDRRSQMQKLVDDFKNEPRVVIAGDFNIGIRFADPKKRQIDNPIEYKVFSDAGFTLGNDGRYKTCPANRMGDPERCYALDNIIVKGLDIIEFRVFNRPDLSDHALVRARLRPSSRVH